MGGEGWMGKVRFRANCESDIKTFSKIPEGKLSMLHSELPTKVSSFALFLIGFTLQNAEFALLFFRSSKQQL